MELRWSSFQGYNPSVISFVKEVDIGHSLQEVHESELTPRIRFEHQYSNGFRFHGFAQADVGLNSCRRSSAENDSRAFLVPFSLVNVATSFLRHTIGVSQFLE
jgi:hypothetical protein